MTDEGKARSMAADEAFDSNVEAKGQTIMSVVEGAGELSTVFRNKAEETLANNGIEDLRADEWYPLGDYLDAFEEISDTVGDKTIVNIGKKIPQNADWPPGVDSVAGGLESISEAYDMNHRGGEYGSYEIEEVGPNEMEVTCQNPYPCDLDTGIIKGAAEEFSPSTAFVDVDERSPRCREDGGDTCVYRVTW